MMESIIDTFILSGNTVLSYDGALFGMTSLGYSSSSMYNFFDKDPVGFVTSLISTSVTSASLTGCDTNQIDKSVQDTTMLVESMSLDDLYELRDLIDEKGNSLKLIMEDI